MTMQAWSPDPGGQITEVGGILAFTSVMQEKKKPAVSKRIPK